MSTTRKKPKKDWLTQMEKWPEAWMGLPEDIPTGKGIVSELEPFVVHMAERGLAPSTLQRHLDNLWALGREIIGDASTFDELSRPAADLLDETLGPFDGPLISDFSRSEQESFDATCRKLYKFRQPNGGRAGQ